MDELTEEVELQPHAYDLILSVVEPKAAVIVLSRVGGWFRSR
jgi:hypothetical protein